MTYPVRLGADESRIVVLSESENISDIDGVVVRTRKRFWAGVEAVETRPETRETFEACWAAADTKASERKTGPRRSAKRP